MFFRGDSAHATEEKGAIAEWHSLKKLSGERGVSTSRLALSNEFLAGRVA